MIINNAASRCSVDFWTKHLQDKKENDRAEIKQVRGLGAADLRDALLEMQREAAVLPRLKNFMYHADFNPCPHERLTEKDWERAFEIFEKQRGIPKGTPRIVVEHEKEGRVHRHVIWSRVDLENMRAFPDGLDAKIAHTAARKIELQLGLQQVVGPFDREPGTPRPKRAPEPWEMYRGMKTKIDPRDITAEVTQLFTQSQNGKEFQAALERHGYQLVTGRRGLLILDGAGKEHSLVKRIEGVKTAQLNAFMRDVDRAALPAVEQAKEHHQQRKIEGLEADRAIVRREIEWEEALARAAIEKEKTERRFVEPKDREKEMRAGVQARPGRREEKQQPVNPPGHQPSPGFEKPAAEATRDDRMEKLKGAAAQVWEAWRQSDGVRAFAAALDDKGITFAAVTADEAYRSHREAAFAKAVGNRAPRFQEGEIVIVIEPRLEYRRKGEIVVPSRIHKIDQSLAGKFVTALDNGRPLPGLDAALQASNQRARQRVADWEAIRLENATPLPHPGRVPLPGLKAGIAKSARVASGILGGIGSGVHAAADAFASLLSPQLTPEQVRQGEQAQHRREAEADRSTDYANYTVELAQQRRKQEQEREAERQRQRDGGGRER